jgi:hypothetical protein
MSEQQTEAAIVAAGKTAPRVTPTDGAFENGSINGAQLRAIPEPLRLLTFCVLVLRNGFTVSGESACASPENFDAKIGRDIAYRNAREKVWPLLGYALREKLAAG